MMGYSIPEGYRNDFALRRLKINIRRTRIMALLIIVLEFLVLGISFLPVTVTNYGGYEWQYRAFYFAIIIGATVFYLVTGLLSDNVHKHFNFLTGFLMAIGFLTLVFYSGITLLDQYRGLPSFVNLFIVMAFAIVVNLKPVKAISLFMSTHILFLTANHVVGIDSMLIFSNYINMTSVIITVCMISYILHKHQIKAYLDELKIRQQNEELARISITDPLTGLYNRRSLDDFLELAYKEAYDNEELLTGIMIDIDYFKGFNDTYGHIKGDEVLERIAGHIDEIVCETCGYVCRYGGDEIFLILKNKNEQEVQDIEVLLSEKVASDRIEHRKSEISDCVTVSIGSYSMAPDLNISPWHIVDKADEALYEMKKARIPKEK